MPDHANFFARILVDYEIDWASLFSEQIHEAATKNSTSIYFSYFMYPLYRVGVESLHYIYSLIDVKCTLGVVLIKAKYNLMAIKRASHQPA